MDLPWPCSWRSYCMWWLSPGSLTCCSPLACSSKCLSRSTPVRLRQWRLHRHPPQRPQPLHLRSHQSGWHLPNLAPSLPQNQHKTGPARLWKSLYRKRRLQSPKRTPSKSPSPKRRLYQPARSPLLLSSPKRQAARHRSLPPKWLLATALPPLLPRPAQAIRLLHFWRHGLPTHACATAWAAISEENFMEAHRFYGSEKVRGIKR